MNLGEFAKRTHIWPRFRSAMKMFWQPIFLLAVIPTIITLASSLHFVVNQAPGSDGSRVVRIAIITLFGAAAYFTGRLSGNLGMVTVIVMFILVGLTLGAIS